MATMPSAGSNSPQRGFPPFKKEFELNNELQVLAGTTASSASFLPGHPRIQLNDAPQLTAFLEQEFFSPIMEDMAPYLWVLSTPSSANISPLHRQKVKDREIIITEDPKLHLVWISGRIFIKPLPRYLLSHSFWEKYLLSDTSPLGSKREQIKASALGYLRTYFYLVKHESDFRIAQDEKLCLIPGKVTWVQFCHFSATFGNIDDLNVSARYRYGELRLTRLNIYVKLFFKGFHYHRVHRQYGAYFARFYGPLLFVFGVFSVVFSAMQVALTTEQVSSRHWTSLWNACRWFSIVTLVFLGSLISGLMLLLTGKFFREWRYALSDRYRSRKQEKAIQRTRHGNSA